MGSTSLLARPGPANVDPVESVGVGSSDVGIAIASHVADYDPVGRICVAAESHFDETLARSIVVEDRVLHSDVSNHDILIAV